MKSRESKSPGCRRLLRAGAEKARTAGSLNELIKTTLGFGKRRFAEVSGVETSKIEGVEDGLRM